MNEQPPSIWKRPWKGPGGFLLWFVLVICAAFVLFFAIGLLLRLGTTGQVALYAAGAAIGLALVGGVGALFGRWLCHWRNLRRFLFGLACCVTLIALFYAEENVRGKAAWGRFKSVWEARGFKFNMPEQAPPPVPDELNFAMAPVVASSYSQILDHEGNVIRPPNTNIIDRMEMPLEVRGINSPTNGGDWMKAIKTDMTVWQSFFREAAAVTNTFPVPAQPGAPAADVLLALGRYDPVIEELREAGRRPQSRYPLNYEADNPAEILLPHLARLKGVVRTLQLRAVAELQAGQAGQALDDVKLMLRLAGAIRNEPLLISHLVGIACVHIALQPVWEGLADHNWSDAQLVVLQEELARPDFLADYAQAIRGEAACASGIIDYLRRHPDQLLSLIRDAWEHGDTTSWLGRLIPQLIPSGWFYQNQLRCVRFEIEWYQPLADVENRTTSPAAAGRANDAVTEELNHKRGPYNFLERLLLPNLSQAVRRFAIAQTAVDQARVAGALERYRLAHGEYPETLDALAPQFIAKLPHDVINGKPLHYSRTADGRFVLYSVGWNETDDGGQVAKREKSGGIDPAKGDWVWQYPSK